jgi:hypothetical protein
MKKKKRNRSMMLIFMCFLLFLQATESTGGEGDTYQFVQLDKAWMKKGGRNGNLIDFFFSFLKKCYSSISSYFFVALNDSKRKLSSDQEIFL